MTAESSAPLSVYKFTDTRRTHPCNMESTTFPADPKLFPAYANDLPCADVQIIATGGSSIAAHSSALASASPVFKSILELPHKNPSLVRTIPIPGVPREAVLVFIGFLYSSRCSKEYMEKYGVHLLVLSHVFSVQSLKQFCIKGLSELLTVENVVDVLQLARLCDAPDLYLKCVKLISNDIQSVEKSEGWRFMQDNDPWLELELLQFLSEEESRQNKRVRIREEQRLYLQLSEAMDCLQHICTEGCSMIGPYDKELNSNKGPCEFSTCKGLQLLIRHFGRCKRRVPGGCSHCKRMWQLLQLHSRICDQPETCKVPLCKQFKLRLKLEKKKDDGRWKLLVKKVVAAKAMSSFVQRKRDEKKLDS